MISLNFTSPVFKPFVWNAFPSHSKHLNRQQDSTRPQEYGSQRGAKGLIHEGEPRGPFGSLSSQLPFHLHTDSSKPTCSRDSADLSIGW